jgi:hypothetical protein
VRKQRVALKDDAEAALGRLDGNEVVAFEGDGPGRRGVEARDHLQRRRLAAARRSEKRYELALADGERQLIDRNLLAEFLAEPLEDEEGHGSQHACGRKRPSA